MIALYYGASQRGRAVMQTILSRFVFLVSCGALALFTAASCSGGPSGEEAVLPRDGVFRIDASRIGRGDVRFYRYKASGKDVVFMVARTREGEIKTAFDACITCYPHGKGYRCEKGRVVCVYCGTAFDLEELGVGKGNCVPIAIEHTMDGDTVLIGQSLIETGAKWF